jgi:hypothetical protein
MATKAFFSVIGQFNGSTQTTSALVHFKHGTSHQELSTRSHILAADPGAF